MITEFSGQNVIIRKIALSDAKDIYENLKDKDITKLMRMEIPNGYNVSHAKKLISQFLKDFSVGKGYAFSIVLKKSNNLIGVIDFFKVNKDTKKAELRYWIGKKYWGLGYTQEAVNLILKFGFSELKLHRISASHFQENEASGKVLLRTGFQLEGIMRDAVLKNGKWYNAVQYSILEQDYKKISI
jgi:RimJ/RimL family protein N-acetyltransferase